jgi:hypothetical protein
MFYEYQEANPVEEEKEKSNSLPSMLDEPRSSLNPRSEIAESDFTSDSSELNTLFQQDQSN